MSDWRKRTTDLTFLKRLAVDDTMSVLSWLKLIGIVPAEAKVSLAGNLSLRTFDPNALPGEYLARTAVEWDSIGLTSPREYLEAIELECMGQGNDVVKETLADLGAIDDREWGEDEYVPGLPVGVLHAAL